MYNGTRTIQGPFCFIQASVRDASLLFLFALLPQLVMLWVTKSYQSLLLIAVSLCASLLCEYANNLYKKRNTFCDGTAVVEGLIVGMFLPQTYPIIPAFFIIFCSLFVSKQLFGGLASSWVNPSMVAIAVAYGIGSAYFSGFLVSGSILETENICYYLFQSGTVNYLQTDAGITAFFNKFLSHFGVTVPEGYVTLFWDSQSAIPAFRFNVLTLCASLLFIASKLGNWIIPVTCLSVYSILVRFFSVMPFTGVMGQGDILIAVLTGGMLFTVFFALPWYGTIPVTLMGQAFYGLTAGGVAFLLNGYGTSSCGAVFTVLVTNLLSPLIQLFEREINVLCAIKQFQQKVKNG